MKSSTQLIDKIIRDKKGELPLKLVELWRSWEEVMGEEISEMACPLGHKESKLILGVEDSILMQEISYRQEEVLEKANNFLGGNVFDNISLELLKGRAPLQMVQVRQDYVRPAMPRPAGLGGLFQLLQEDSPIAKAYQAYVEHFRARPGSGAEEKEE